MREFFTDLCRFTEIEIDEAVEPIRRRFSLPEGTGVNDANLVERIHLFDLKRSRDVQFKTGHLFLGGYTEVYTLMKQRLE